MLVVLLLVQLVLGAAVIYAAVNGFPFLGGNEGSSAAAAAADPRPRVDRFDENRAFALLREQVAYGQRPAGSPALRRLGDRLRRLLPHGHFESVPGGLRNIAGRLPGRLPAVVIGAHYDTEAHPAGFVGANDGAAGTAAVVELAQTLQRGRPRGARELRFVLFDGEEEPLGSRESDFLRDALRGSKAYVRAHRRQVRQLVLLDYVANRGVRFPRELGSNPALWARLRAAATRVGVGRAFPNRIFPEEILDDHTPFTAAGIPSIDLIDFGYRYRDTIRDTVDKVSPRALDVTGEAVAELVRGL